MTTPDDLEYPVLQTRVKTNDGYRTVAPLGKWVGVYSSTEINSAMVNFGYKFNIIRGFLFARTVVFKEFVEYFYNMKSKCTKDNPRYYIAKLMMNSVYGKMGQDYKLETHVIVNEMELIKLIQDKNYQVSSTRYM